jgi:hypothetical protein
MEREDWIKLDGRLQSIQFLLEVLAAMRFSQLEKAQQDAALEAIYTRLSEAFSVPADTSSNLREYLGDVHAAAEEHLEKLLRDVSSRADEIRDGGQ